MVTNLHNNFRNVIYTLFVNMWSLACSAPAAPEVLTNVILDLKKQADGYVRMKRENESLKRCADRHQSVINKLQEKINSLKLLLEEEKRKSEDMRMEFNDATKNAKLVVDSVKRSSDNLWSLKFKEYSSIFNQKLAEKDITISEYSEYLERLRADFKALEAQKIGVEKMYEQALNELSALSPREKFCEGTQTELLHSDIYLRSDLDHYLEENTRTVKHNLERELNEQIIQAKLNTFCNTCLRPANIHCCMSANYCTKTCAKKNNKAHQRSCQKIKETRSRQDSEVSLHQQFCHPQVNQTQTKKISCCIQVEQSSEIISTANKEAHLYVYPSVSTPSVSTNNKS